jgi:hypothetical protein
MLISMIIIINTTTTLHHHTQPSRLRILFPTQACLLASKKGHILRLEKTRLQTASNGILDRQPSPSISTSPSPNPKQHQVGTLNG